MFVAVMQHGDDVLKSLRTLLDVSKTSKMKNVVVVV